jgi:hypothetical protein
VLCQDIEKVVVLHRKYLEGEEAPSASPHPRHICNDTVIISFFQPNSRLIVDTPAAGRGHKMEPVVVIIILVVVAVVILVIWLNSKAARRRKEKLRKWRQHIADTYGKALGLKFRQLVVRDEYGHVNNDRWEKEKVYFLRNALGMPKLGRGVSFSDLPLEHRMAYGQAYSDALVLVDSVAREFSQTLPVMGDISEVLNGLDYEHFGLMKPVGPRR